MELCSGDHRSLLSGSGTGVSEAAKAEPAACGKAGKGGKWVFKNG